MATCPADGQTLIKVPLARVQVLGCPRCRGVWVAREQLMTLALEQAKTAAPVSSEVAAKPPAKTAHRFCTVQCQTPLEPKIVRGIEIDRCTTCDGYWFDGGEVQRLLKAYKPPSLQTVGKKLIHEVRNRAKGPTSYQSKWRQSIADASLDGAAELVVEVVLESLNSAEW
ncbi:MAG TPA: zf-TFIIB domain-containing protein [Verrucomicrobiae bacterium]